MNDVRTQDPDRASQLTRRFQDARRREGRLERVIRRWVVRREISRRIQKDGLSVRDVERLVSEKLGQEQPEGAHLLPGPGKKKRTRSEHVASLEQEVRHALGMKVEIRQSARGRGKMVIHFQNHDEFERLHQQLTDAFDRTPRRKAG